MKRLACIFLSLSIAQCSVMASTISDAIDKNSTYLVVNEKPNMKNELILAKRKNVNKYRIKTNEDNTYSIFLMYYNTQDVEYYTKKIDANTREKWGVSFKDTQYKTEAIYQYLYDSGVVYSEENHNPSELIKTKKGNCQAITLFASDVLTYMKVPHKVITGTYEGTPHMWLSVNGVFRDITFALNSDVQMAYESNPEQYKTDEKINVSYTHSSLDGKVLFNGKNFYSLKDNGNLYKLENGRNILTKKGVKEIKLSGGSIVSISNEKEENKDESK